MPPFQLTGRKAPSQDGRPHQLGLLNECVEWRASVPSRNTGSLEPLSILWSTCHSTWRHEELLR